VRHHCFITLYFRATAWPLLRATRTVPIVIAGVPNAVGAGFVESLARPGGYATGIILIEYRSAKWLELLKQMAPSVTRVAVMRDCAKATWLVLQQLVMVLLSVGSLQALRRPGSSQADEPYIAFGNPLLTGPSGSDKRVWDKQTCRQDAKPTRVAEARGIVRRGVALRAMDLTELRTQELLPETADELCAVAEALGVVGRESEKRRRRPQNVGRYCMSSAQLDSLPCV
jgi:ABC transporter substrate binding protein